MYVMEQSRVPFEKYFDIWRNRRGVEDIPTLYVKPATMDGALPYE